MDISWPLSDGLQSEADYFNRFHCAATLLQLLGNSACEAVYLSADIPDRMHHSESIEGQLAKQIGARELDPLLAALTFVNHSTNIKPLSVVRIRWM